MEKFFWADQIAEKVISEKGDKEEYVCASGITPSGTVHIGNFREVITTDMVVKALKDKGKKVRFIYSWDDYDRFRKIPRGIDEDYEQYIGMPLSEVPSPNNKNISYAEENEKVFENSLKKVFITPEFIYQHKMNKKCAYSKGIKTALDNNDKIKKILNKYRKEPLSEDWMPIAIYCDKCKKDSTKIHSVEEYNISYSCDCGFSETFDFRKKGIVSIKWRIDWPLRWDYEKVDFEPGGIDHSVYGGSFTTAKEISKKIFNFEPPIYQFYDWINIKGGGVFASSTGNSLTLDEVEEVYEPEVLRYLFVGTKPKSSFHISFDNDVIKNYDDFDSLEKKYFSEKCNPKEKRMYEMSVVEIPKSKPERESFRHLITLVQIGKTSDLNKESKKRAEKVKNWLDKHANSEMKFEIKTEIEVEISEKQKEALIELKEALSVKDFNEEELFNEFYNICEAVGIPIKEFFEGAYSVILNKTKGPKLASLILEVGKERIISLLEKIK